MITNSYQPTSKTSFKLSYHARRDLQFCQNSVRNRAQQHSAPHLNSYASAPSTWFSPRSSRHPSWSPPYSSSEPISSSLSNSSAWSLLSSFHHSLSIPSSYGSIWRQWNYKIHSMNSGLSITKSRKVEIIRFSLWQILYSSRGLWSRPGGLCSRRLVWRYRFGRRARKVRGIIERCLD